VNTFTTEATMAARQSGFSFVCSLCLRLHEGNRMAGGDWDTTRCTGTFCKGPLGGGSYPEYEGPIKDALNRFCFICGTTNPPHAIASCLPGHPRDRLLGACDEHAKLVDEGMFDERPTGTRPKQKIRIAGHEVEL